MRKKILLLFAFVLIVFSRLSAQNYAWGIRLGNTGSDLSVATTNDNLNNSFTLIYYYNTLTLDSAGTPVTVGNFGNRDIALVKYDCNKVFQWVIRIGGSFLDGGSFNKGGLIVDTLGNLYVSSTINGSANFVSANGASTVRTSYGAYDAFLMKVSSTTGIIQWINLNGSSTGNDEGAGLALDRNQNVYSTGLFYGTISFNSTSGPVVQRTSFGANSDIYFTKYNPAGVLQIAQRGGGFLQDLGSSIAVDSSGGIYVAGNFSCCGFSMVTFGGNNLGNAGGWGGFIAKADAAGNWLWGNGMGSATEEALVDVVVSEITDRVYVVGYYTGATTFSTRPSGIAVPLNSNGLRDIVVAAMNFNGGTQWARSIGGTGDDYGFGITLDLEGNIAICGAFGNTTNFGGTTLNPSGTGSGYLAKYSPSNVFVNAQKVGTGTYTIGSELHTSPTGIINVVGNFTGTSIFGLDTMISLGAEDGFLLSFFDNDTTLIGASKTILSCTADTAVLTIPNKRIGNFVWFRNDTIYTASNGNQIKTTSGGVYKVVALNYCALLDTSITITVTKSIYFNLTPISDLNICRGDSAQFNASGGTTYNWTPSTGLSDPAVANPFVKPIVGTTYYLTVTQGACLGLDTVVVTPRANCCLTCSTPFAVNQGVVACYPFNGNANDESGNSNNAAVINATLTQDRFGTANRAYAFNGANAYLEVPNSASLQSPSGNISFSFWAQVLNWNVAAGPVNYTPILSKSVTNADAQYRAMIRSNGAYAMTNAKSWNAMVGSNTNLNTWYFFTISCSNDTLRYYRNGVLLGFATGPVPYTLNNTTPLRMGRNDVNTAVLFNGRLDEVRVYNRTISAAEVTKLFNLSNINGLPLINAGADKSICVGDSTYISPAGSNGTFLWTPATGLSSDTTRNVYSHTDSTRTYVITVDLSGCKNSDTIIVNAVNFQPYAGVDQTICVGDTASLTAINGGATYAWTPNYNITNIANPSTQVYPRADTNYIISSNNGICSRKDTVRITVNVPTINAGPDISICKGDTAHFNITTNGTARWSPLTYLSDSIGNTLYSVADTTINYYITTNYLGCFGKDTVKVVVVSLPVEAGPDQTICIGDSVQLNATGGGLNYIWIPKYNISDTSIANPYVKPLVTTRYFAISYNFLCARYDSVLVTVKQAVANLGPDKQICNGDSVQLNANVIGPYTWSPLATLSDTSLSPYAKPAVTTDYIISINNSGCLAADTVKVTVNTFNISAGADKIICYGDTVQLTATGGVKYNWLPAYNINDTGIANPLVYPLGPTKYFLISTNGICWRVDTVFVDVKTLTGSAGKDTSLCLGQSIDLNATGGANYQWLTSYKISNQFISNPTVNPDLNTNYVVRIGDGAACFFLDTVLVVVNKYPTVYAGVDLKHCPGELIQIKASLSDYSSFFWSPATGLSDKLALQPFASVVTPTNYIINALNGYCYNSDTVLVTANPKVVASFKANPQTGIAPLSVLFTNLSTNGLSYDWSFGEMGATSTLKEPTYVYTTEGIYVVFLTVKDDLGCFDTDSTIVNVTTVENIYAPTAFSPNHDGINDEFRFLYNSNRFDLVQYQIYNRWGIKVFETLMPGGIWWNGTLNGEPADQGIYTYVGSAKDKKGKIYKMNGTIALIR